MTWIQAITIILTVLGGQLGLLLWVQRDLGARIGRVESELGTRMTQLHHDLTAWQRHATERTDRVVDQLGQDGRQIASLQEQVRSSRS